MWRWIWIYKVNWAIEVFNCWWFIVFPYFYFKKLSMPQLVDFLGFIDPWNCPTSDFCKFLMIFSWKIHLPADSLLMSSLWCIRTISYQIFSEIVTFIKWDDPSRSNRSNWWVQKVNIFLMNINSIVEPCYDKLINWQIEIFWIFSDRYFYLKKFLCIHIFLTTNAIFLWE